MNKPSAALPFLLSAVLAVAAALPARADDTSSLEITFAKLTDEILADEFDFGPLGAVSLGLHQYDGKFGDYSRAAVDAEIQRGHVFLTRLEAIDPARLSAPSALDYKLLLLGVKNGLFQTEETGAYDHNPMTYAGAFDANVYLKRDYAPLADRLRSIVATERQVPAMFAAAHGRTSPKSCRSRRSIWPSSSLKRQRGFPAARSRRRRQKRAGPGVAGGVQNRQRPRRRRTDRLRRLAGQGTAAQGRPQRATRSARTRYRKMLAYSEALDIPPAKLLEIGLAELKREQGEFAAAAKIIDPSKPPIEVFKAIQHDHPTAESLLPDIRKHLEMIRGFMVGHNIIDIPSEVRANVEETPKYLRAGSFASSDNPGPFEVLGAQAYYYVTPTEPEWPDKEKDEWLTAFNYYTADIVSIHEVYPGHYVQALRMNASPVSKVQRIFGSYAYIEGWAHYCEQMVGGGRFRPEESRIDPNDLQGAKYHLAQSDEALLRICRLCVSIKLHTQGMSVEEATKFFMDNWTTVITTCSTRSKPNTQAHYRRSAIIRAATFDPSRLPTLLATRWRQAGTRSNLRREPGSKARRNRKAAGHSWLLGLPRSFAEICSTTRSPPTTAELLPPAVRADRFRRSARDRAWKVRQKSVAHPGQVEGRRDDILSLPVDAHRVAETRLRFSTWRKGARRGKPHGFY